MVKKNTNQLYKWRRWKYENTALLVVSLVFLIFLAQTPALDTAIGQAGELGYFGAFIAGIFFVSTFTVAPAALILFHLAETLNPLLAALLAGLGAMIGDYIIFRFMKDRVFEELRPLLIKLHTPKIMIMFKTPYFAWVLPLFGAVIIASPFPDEVGVGMLGLSKVKQWQFFLLAFTLNAVGIFIVVSFSKIV